MGISERKVREKEDLKKSILDAARELFLEKGYDQTSIRNIAEKIEYSPTTIYLYFKDKDSIFHELHDQAFLKLKNEFSVLQAISDPYERLKGMGRSYIEFAVKNKELYDLMFILYAPMNALDRCEEDWDEGEEAFCGLLDLVKECIDVGYFHKQNAREVSFVIWSTVHGMCSLLIRNRLQHVFKEDFDSIIEQGTQAFFQILENTRKKS